ncbi:MAG: Rrf2 family transcriptional regulator [candidate division Zixibacteria bacterium]|nr:Rrf2 family transcriptional regulator [candidate division Zixibacteria bacterium]NIR65074.1 Rrf2 family transcriptional regulator [candidate division Zixibacteria bacterium]NIS18225.1 Rrf2 family transcriptional regulator [candidate division Zixibacteria bacterium]NIS46833.1 Rrf2 family transcriptional regulator [candidate division Zixibacteria bacterium]NIU14978.1 Rrf2 family transcriptional regulator [candidate division Zixibacteria bacterium]
MLSQTAMYAIKAMGFIANHGDNGPVLSRTISEKMEIPQNFLSKIMNRLVQEGYLKSIRGTNGGFILVHDPDDVSLKEIAALFMNLNEMKRCFLGLSECDGSCSMHKQWSPIMDRFEKLLENTSIKKVKVQNRGELKRLEV